MTVSEVGEGGGGRRKGVTAIYFTYLYAAVDDDVRYDGVACLEDTQEAKMKEGERK